MQIVAGFFPKPSLAPYAHLLAVKCAEVTFPSGFCFSTKPQDLVAHKTWVLSSNEAPCELSWFGVTIHFTRVYEDQRSARGGRKEGALLRSQESPLRGLSREQAVPVHPTSISAAILLLQLLRRWDRVPPAITYTKSSSLCSKAVAKLPSCFPRSSSFPSHAL